MGPKAPIIRKVLCYAGCFSALWLAAQGCLPSSPIPTEGDQISKAAIVRVRTSKRTYKIGEPIAFGVEIENRSRSPIYVERTLGHQLNLLPTVKDKSGKIVWTDDHRVDFAVDGSDLDFVRLDPGHIYGIAKVETTRPIAISQEGEYELTVLYDPCINKHNSPRITITPYLEVAIKEPTKLVVKRGS